MENIFINGYSCICNIGDNIEEIFKNLIDLNDGFLKKREDIIKGSSLYFGTVNTKLPYIKDERYNLRCNRLLLHCLFQIEDKIKEIIQKYDKRKIGIIIGTTNSGINEFEISNNIFHTEISNPAGFLKNYLNLKGIYLGTSSACTSGIKALIEAVNLINKGIMDCAITGGADALSYMPHTVSIRLNCYPIKKQFRSPKTETALIYRKVRLYLFWKKKNAMILL